MALLEALYGKEKKDPISTRLPRELFDQVRSETAKVNKLLEGHGLRKISAREYIAIAIRNSNPNKIINEVKELLGPVPSTKEEFNLNALEYRIYNGVLDYFWKYDILSARVADIRTELHYSRHVILSALEKFDDIVVEKNPENQEYIISMYGYNIGRYTLNRLLNFHGVVKLSDLLVDPWYSPEQILSRLYDSDDHHIFKKEGITYVCSIH